LSNIAPDFEPNPPDVLGHEETRIVKTDPIPVVLESPAHVQALPAQIAVSRSITLTTLPEIILPADARRSRAILVAAASVRLGSRNDCDNDSAFLLTTAIPLEYRHGDEIWARADTGTARLSILIEEWTA
jgi:hypothetical protein